MTNGQQKQRDFALDVVRRLRRAGFEALWAGGCVRDQLLGRDPVDYDVATSATPDQVRELFGQRRTLALGAAFGVIAVLRGRTLSPIEVATFRTDGRYQDGRHPESVTYADAQHDALRRDFTINGLFFDPIDQRIIDYVNGRRDLDAGVIRAIGQPRRRFDEDKLRMLRAIRFATTFDFQIDEATLDAVQEMAHDIRVVSAERIGGELTRLLGHEHRSRGVQLLAESRLLEPLFPEMFSLATNNPTAWQSKIERLSELNSATIPAALALLLEGVATPTEAKQICRRFRTTNKIAQRTAWLLGSLGDVRNAAELPWPRLQRLLVHDGAVELVAVLAAIVESDDDAIQRCREMLSLPSDILDPPALATGDDLIAHGMRPGPHFASLLEHLRDQQLEGFLTTKGEALAEAMRWVDAQSDAPER